MERVRLETDRHVLAAVLEAGRLTRADVAVAAEVSKPTASQSVRRLVEAGMLVEAGLKEGGPGRTGVFYELSRGVGLALAIDAGPGGVVAECLDARGESRHREEREVGITVTPEELRSRLREVVAGCENAVGCAVSRRVVGVADPVDRAAARVVHLAGSPFATGEVELGDIVGPAGVVDNDVHWAAFAELRQGAGAELRSFVHVFLGAGLGAALVDGGLPVTGARGLAGEIAYVPTIGPDGRAVRALDAFAALGLLVPGTTSIDVGALRSRWVDASDREAIVAAVGGVLASAVAMLEPAGVVVGGPWADLPGLVPALGRQVGDLAPHEVPVLRARVADAPRVGVRLAATERARADLLAGL